MKKHKEPSQRQLRVGEEVRHAVAYFLQKNELRDPILSQVMVSISEVKMSPDLKIATCYVTPLDSTDPKAPSRDETVQALNRNKKYIRGQIAHRLHNLRYMPDFRFRADTSFDNFAKIDALLRSPEVARDLNDADEEETDDYNRDEN